jgi:hypothetical protein
MLVASEAHFFDQPASNQKEQKDVAQDMRANRSFKVLIPKGTERSPTLTHPGNLFAHLPGSFDHVPRPVV